MFAYLPVEARFRSIGTLRKRNSPRRFLIASQTDDRTLRALRLRANPRLRETRTIACEIFNLMTHPAVFSYSAVVSNRKEDFKA